MINKLSNISYKFIKSNRSIAISCITAIALSIFLISSLMNFAINSENNLKNETKEAFGDFEYQIGYDSDSVKMIDDDFIDKVKNINGVSQISETLVSNIDINGISVYSVGIENDKLSKSKYKYSENVKPDNIIINKVLADSLNLSVGDKLNINGCEKNVQDIFDDKTNTSSPIEILLMNRQELKKILNVSKEADFIMIKVDDNSEISQVLSGIDSELRVESFEQNDFVVQNVNTLKYFVIFLGVLVFLICGIFIISNLQQYIYKYTDQFAIIKAIGGSCKQVFRILLIQTLIMNVIGVCFGIVATFISVKFFLKSFEFYIVEVLLISLLGFIIVQVLLFIPGLKTSKILPIKAMQNNEKNKDKLPRVLYKFSYTSIIIGLLLFVYYTFFDDNSTSLFQSISSFALIIIGNLLLFRIKLKRILDFLDKIFSFIFGVVGSVAIKTLQTQIKKSSLIIFSITITMIITFVGSNFTKSLIKNNEKYYKSEYLTDIVVTSNNEMDFDESQELFKTVNSLDDICASIILDGYVTSYSGKNIQYSLANLEGLKNQKIIKEFDGDGKNRIVISKEFAKKNNINIGDEILLAAPQFNKNNSLNVTNESKISDYRLNMKVVDICEGNVTNYSDILADFSNKELINSETTILRKIYINTEKDYINQCMKQIKSSFQSIRCTALSEVLNESNKAIEKRWAYFKIALILIIATTIFGAINSLKNNFNARRKEYAVLRCMKFTQSDLRKMLLLQVTVFLLLGEILGLFLGYVGSIIVTSMDGFNFVNIDYTLILFNVILSLIICIICLVPYIFKVSKGKIIAELGKEE